MGYQKLQVGRITAMDDKKSDFSDTVNLNDPILDASGNPKTYTLTSFTFLSPFQTITASGATFISDGVQPGDVVYTTSTPVAGARVASVISETKIVIEGIIGTIPGTQFNILKGSTEPAVFYVGTTPAAPGVSQIKVRTAGGDDITFHNPPEGSFLPVQVKRVWLSGTTVSDVLALF